MRLLRKALKKADLAYIPVVSLNYTGMEKDPGFDLSLKFIFKLIKAIVYGDLLMCLRNQLLPYEEREGSVDSLIRHWCDEISEQFKEGKGLAHDEILVNMDRICRSFSQIKVTGEEKIKVGHCRAKFMSNLRLWAIIIWKISCTKKAQRSSSPGCWISFCIRSTPTRRIASFMGIAKPRR